MNRLRGVRPEPSAPSELTRMRARLFRFLFFRSRLPYRWVRAAVPLLFGDRDRLSQVHTFRMRLDPRDILQTRLLLDGVWEPAFTRWWAYLSSRSPVIFDVGVHCGYYSLLAKSAAADTEIHGFEPNPRLREQATANLRLNGFEKNVRISPAAISDVTGEQSLYLRDIEPATASVFEPAEAYDRTVTVPSVTLDDYRVEHGIDRVDLVKFDIEGAEALAVDGMRKGLQDQAYRYLMIESHRVLMPPGLAEAMRDLLSGAGYRLFRILETSAVPLPLDDAIPDYDQWLAVSPDALGELGDIEDGGSLMVPEPFVSIYRGVVWSPA